MQKLRFERNKVIRNIKSSAYSVRLYLLVKYLHLSYVQRSIDMTNPCIDNNRHFHNHSNNFTNKWCSKFE